MATQKTKIFSKSLFIQGFKYIRFAGIGCAVTALMLNLLYVNLLADFYFDDNCSWMHSLVKAESLAPFCILSSIFAFLLVMSQFSFLNNRKGSDFYHSVPEKRITVYLSFTASICVWIILINLSTITLNTVLFNFSSTHYTTFREALVAFSAHTATALAVAGIASICRMLAGDGIANVFYFLCAISIPRVLILCFKEFVASFNPSILIENTWVYSIFIDTSVFFTAKTIILEEVQFENLFVISGLLIKAIIFFAVGAYFYVKRKSQIAGNSEATKFTKNVFITFATMPLLTLGLWFYFMLNEEIFSVIFSGVAIMVYFVFALIISKNAKQTLKSLPLLVIPLVASILFIALSYGVAEGFRLANPSADEVKSVAIINSVYDAYDTEALYFNVDTSSEKAINTVLSSLEWHSEKSESEHHVVKYNVKITTKNGREKYRQIYFSTQDAQAFLDEISLSEKFALIDIPSTDKIKAVGFHTEIGVYTEIEDETHREKIVRLLKEEYDALNNYDKKNTNASYNDNFPSPMTLELYSEGKWLRFRLRQNLFPKTQLAVIEALDEQLETSSAEEFISQFKSPMAFTMKLVSISNNYHKFSVSYSENDNKEAKEEFAKSLSKDALSDYSDLSRIYAVKVNDKLLFVSLTQEQVVLLGKIK